jgi:hypothetical protein
MSTTCPPHQGTLPELLKVNEIAHHFRRGKVIEKAQRALEQEPVLSAAELLRDDDARVRATGRLPLLVEWGEIADVEREERALFRGCEGELLLIGCGASTGFFGPQDVETTSAQVNGQPGDDMTVEVKPKEERFKTAGIAHGPALPQR